MTRSYLEIIFRHKALVLLPVVVAFLLGTALAFSVPREYQATASLWADSAVTAESTIGTSGGESPPSTGQAALFTELLGTQSFLLAAVEDTPLAPAFEDLPEQSVDKQLNLLRQDIASTTPGPHILNIAATQPTPEDAKALTTALVAQFLTEQDELLTRRAETETAFLKSQLDVAEQAVAEARSPAGLGLPAGSALAEAALQTAQQQRLEAEQAYQRSVAASESIGDRSVLYVRDEADTALRVSRLKTLALGSAGGLLAGLTVSVLIVLMLMARDRSVKTESELEQLLGLTVVGSIDDFGRQHRRLAPAGAPRAGELESGATRG